MPLLCFAPLPHSHELEGFPGRIFQMFWSHESERDMGLNYFIKLA